MGHIYRDSGILPPARKAAQSRYRAAGGGRVWQAHALWSDQAEGKLSALCAFCWR